VGKKSIPYGHNNENILLGVTKTGGHLSYFEGALLPTKQWFPEPTFEFLNYLKNKDVTTDGYQYQ
jgi:predicted alpha/beta-fold hydrolase